MAVGEREKEKVIPHPQILQGSQYLLVEQEDEGRWPEWHGHSLVSAQRCVGPSESSIQWSRDFGPRPEESRNSSVKR